MRQRVRGPDSRRCEPARLPMYRAAAAAASRVHSTRVPGGRAASRDHLLATATLLRAGREGS
eukprot:7014582-Alexandrium_andersonii.AAC.1